MHEIPNSFNSMGYSAKGWTDGEIECAWIEDFDKKTKAKADGRRRVLIVDGHNSHYTLEFLTYARENNIDVLCYPAHATHVYQGLDVVVFSVLKKCWSEERDAYQTETGDLVSKANFLSIYGKAHVRALTEENIRMAFKKTGVVPFDPNILSAQQFSPSRETTLEAAMPLSYPTPVKMICDAFAKLAHKRTPGTDSSVNGDESDDSLIDELN